MKAVLLILLLLALTLASGNGQEQGGGKKKGHFKQPEPGETTTINPGEQQTDTEVTVSPPGSIVDIASSGELDTVGVDIQPAGKMQVDGSVIASNPVVIEQGGELSGSGIVTTPVLDNSGTLTSTGSGLTIIGNLQSEPSSTLNIASSSSVLKVVGQATLNGKLQLGFTPTVGINPILTASLVNGRFSQVQTPFSGTIASIYARDGVDIVALPHEQGLVSMSTTMPVASIVPKKLVSILAPNASQVTNISQVTLANLFLIRAILTNEISVEGDIRVWAAGYGNFANLGSGSGEKQTRLTSGGIVVGGSKKFCDHYVAGLAGGYNHTWSNSLDSNAGWGAGYIGYFSKGFYIYEATAGGRESFTTNRKGLLGNAIGNSSGVFFNTFGQAGYNVSLKPLTLGPFVMLQYSWNNTEGYTEKGSAAPLKVNSSSQGSLLTDLGLQFELSILNARIAWEHEYINGGSTSVVSLADVPGTDTSVSGTRLGHDSLVVNVGISIPLSKTITFDLNYDSQLGRKNYYSNGVSGGIKIRF